ncbi:hypothetical protein DdX_21494 [Ditylenchus destructor]|uniref:Uncharacterized protein n=1 Tax=Ditylenchus destructor TaxID=166010 RepID=A0AAD4MFQ8_9BILA|nr:hypothetical protein DdX_21494 [Ditylenchus destructor]
MSSRKKVEIPDKAWLDTLKFLMGPQWLKMRFVSRQVAEVVRGNISELPRIIIDNVHFSEAHLRSKPIEMVASGIAIPPSEKKEWFMKRGINVDARTDLQQQGALIGMGANYGNQSKPTIFYYAEANDLVKTSKTGRRKQKTVWRKIDLAYGQKCQVIGNPQNLIFSAEFNPDVNEYSWCSLEYFLNLLYNPLTFIKKVEMYALNENLTDAFFLGEDYGSFVHCGTFSVMGDFSKSLPWMQRNVRADWISIPGRFTNVEISYKEVGNLLLDTPWICANQTENVEPVKIEFESVQYWKWFIKILIKKFRTLTTIDHTVPLIEFAFYKAVDENTDLDFLAWDPEVVKLKPEDSHGAEAAYMISNGRNRMYIAIFERPDDRTTYDVSVKLYTNQSAIPSRKKVHILDDTWLESLKFLSFPNWPKALCVE